MMRDRFILRMIFLIPACASGAVPVNESGSTACSRSELWLDTQLGVEGHGASLPSLIPRLAGRTPVHPMLNMLSTTIAESMRSIPVSIACLLKDDAEFF